MDKTELNPENYELVGVTKKEGVFQTEDGRSFEYANYYIKFKRTDSDLIMTAKVDRVFKDYVEED